MISKQAIYAASPTIYRVIDNLYRRSRLFKIRQAKAAEIMRSSLAMRLKEDIAFLDADNKDHVEIIDGPFKGMKYNLLSCGSVFLPKVYGTYESEIVPWVEEIISTGYDAIIDVGCAEGYYAVGFARSMPKVRIQAFDLNFTARAACKANAVLNNVDGRIEISERFDAAQIDIQKNGRTIIFCDVEGAEIDLLDPVRNPILLNIDMLIELHDIFRPGLTQTLIERFKRSHQIHIVYADPSKIQIRDQHVLDARAPGAAWGKFISVMPLRHQK